MIAAAAELRRLITRWSVVSTLGLAMLAGLAGCNDAPNTSPVAAPKTGRELLERMAEAYRKATTYADAGEVRRHFVLNGQAQDETYNFAVTLERPNKLRLQTYDTSVVSDGKLFRAAIDNLPGQTLERDAPAQMTSEEVYSDPTLLESIVGGAASGSLQLALLVDSNPLAKILEGSDVPELLPVQKIDGFPCWGVRMVRPDGKLVFWIDQASYVLRRAEYPTDEFERFLKREGTARDVTLVADFKGATFNAPVDAKAFQFEAPEGARVVKRFEAIERPEPLTPLLGKKIGDYYFTTLDGKKVTAESLRGKVVVLEFWLSESAPCFRNLASLNVVDGRYRGNDKVAVFAVNIDPLPAKGPPVTQVSTAGQPPAASSDRQVTNPEVEAAFKRAQISIPILRDADQQARTVFGVEKVPNVFILGPDGTVQDHEVGQNPELATDLPQRIDRLLAGQNITADSIQRYEARVQQYQAQFQTADGNQAAAERTVIAPQSEPVTLKLGRQWNVTALKEPGNLLTYVENGKSKVLVLDGWKKVVELGTDGKVVSEHPIEIATPLGESVVNTLRTAVDQQGKRWFVGGTSAMQQYHVYDANWKRVLSYPEEKTPGGVADAVLADLDGDGQMELNVGFYDVLGIHNVALDGNRRWSARSVGNVLRLAVTLPDASQHRALLCTHERGTIAMFTDKGQDAGTVQLGNRFARSVYCEDLNGDKVAEIMAITSTAPGNDTLVGLDRAGRESWNYQLPLGRHRLPVEAVTAGKLVGVEAQWVVAAGGGSIHLLTADGTPIDRFNYGAAISGIAVVPGEKPLLVVSHGGGVDAWTVTMP